MIYIAIPASTVVRDNKNKLEYGGVGGWRLKQTQQERQDLSLTWLHQNVLDIRGRK